MERNMPMIPLTVAHGKSIQLSAGKHKQLVMEIIDEYGPRFTPGGIVLHVGDSGNMRGYFDEAGLVALGVKEYMYGKMPDVVIHYPAKNWIFLIEASSSHGPINAKRRKELAELFASSTASEFYVTAFPTRSEMACYVGEISWETEVWIADAPDHLIHFNGDKFLGPYKKGVARKQREVTI